MARIDPVQHDGASSSPTGRVQFFTGPLVSEPTPRPATEAAESSLLSRSIPTASRVATDSEQQLLGPGLAEDQTDLPGASSGPGRPHCAPTGVQRTDYFLDVTSTLPHYYSLPAQLDVHQVSPFYRHGHQHCPIQAAVLVHGRSIDGVSGFDLQYRDYSLQENMALAGIDTFSVNLLGWGLSSRFALDDPCNASQSDQRSFLIPNPLKDTCASPDPFHFTNTQAMVDQLDGIVTDVQARLGVRTVSLFAHSNGGNVVGPYTRLNQTKVQNLVLLAPGYDLPTNPPDELPQPGPSLLVRNRALTESLWTDQVDNMECPGEQDPAILEPIWRSMMARDPIGSTWGTNGISRFPSSDQWGWNGVLAPEVTVPTLVVSGLRDTIVPTATMVRLYNDLGSEKKVLIEIACGSHFPNWEGSTSPTWNGPHASLQDAVVQWMTSESYQNATRGTFQVNADGSIDGPF